MSRPGNADGSEQYEAAWTAAKQREAFSCEELAAELAMGIDTMSAFLSCWIVAGAAEQLVSTPQEGRRKQRNYRLVAGAELPPLAWPFGSKRPVTAFDTIWRSMRGLKSFTPTDLSAHSTVPGVEASRDLAQAYCRALLAAGYLKVIRKAVPGRREAIYRLVRDTGPVPPRERRVRALRDENLGQTILLDGSAT